MTGKFKRAREVMKDHYVAVIGVITKDTAASERHKPSTHRGDSIRLLRGSENASYWWVQVHILLLTARARDRSLDFFEPQFPYP